LTWISLIDELLYERIYGWIWCYMMLFVIDELIIWMYILMNMMLHDVVHNWWIMELWCEVVVVVVAVVVANVIKVVSCCRCRWSCWSLLNLLLSPRIIIHIKLGVWCPVECINIHIKLGAWCPVECLIIHTTLRAYVISVKKELNRLYILGTLITWFASYPAKSSQILKNHSIMLFTSNANSL